MFQEYLDQHLTIIPNEPALFGYQLVVDADDNIQEEIESAAGRVEFLSHQSSYSTINLTFFQPLEGYKPTDITPSFLTRVSNSFKIGTSWIADLFVGLIAIWPLLIIITGIYFGWKKLRPVKTPKQIL